MDKVKWEVHLIERLFTLKIEALRHSNRCINNFLLCWNQTGKPQQAFLFQATFFSCFSASPLLRLLSILLLGWLGSNMQQHERIETE